jgi:peptidyl-prolyl cis-trans isomerase A (cyclophilin A)
MKHLWSPIYAAIGVLAAMSLAGCWHQPVSQVSSEQPPHDPIPELFRVRFETTKGNFVVEVTKAWAPLAAERFYLLTQNGFWKTQRFYRVIEGNMAQFGLNILPADKQWLASVMRDEPVRQSNRRGTVVFSAPGPHMRSTAVIISMRDNVENDVKGFSPFGKVIFGMDVVDSLYSGYGELAPRGKGPDLGRLTNEGLGYLTSSFPNLDYIREAVVIE